MNIKSSYQQWILGRIIFEGCLLEVKFNGRKYVHALVSGGGKKTIIRSDTSKNIQSILKQKVKIWKR